jgi:hypothetical protein
MNKREIKRALKAERNSGGETLWLNDDRDGIIASVYLGSYLSLDPCGKYHHFLSPNGITKRCERFWWNMEECADELGAWIESGQGDGLDMFLSWHVTDVEPYDIRVNDTRDTMYLSPDGVIFSDDGFGEMQRYDDLGEYMQCF